MSYFGKNIRKIRTLKKLSQSEIATIFELTRASIGAYEEGRAEAKVDTIIGIAKYFSISVDSLLCKELTVNEILHFNLPLEELSKSKKVDSLIENKYLIPFIETGRFLEYIKLLNDKKSIENFPTVMLPQIERENHCAFEHWGSEMHTGSSGILHFDIVIGKKINLESQELSTNKVYTIVSSNNIQSRVFEKKEGDEYIFSCFNPLFGSERMLSNSILECFEVIGKISKVIERPSNVEERIYRIEKELEKMSKKK